MYIIFKTLKIRHWSRNSFCLLKIILLISTFLDIFYIYSRKYYIYHRLIRTVTFWRNSGFFILPDNNIELSFRRHLSCDLVLLHVFITFKLLSRAPSNIELEFFFLNFRACCSLYQMFSKMQMNTLIITIMQKNIIVKRICMNSTGWKLFDWR